MKGKRAQVAIESAKVGRQRSAALDGLLHLSGPWGVAGAAILFIALLSLLYPEAVFQGKVFVTPDSVAPVGFADYVATHGGGRALWNPFIFAGMPAFASLSYNPGLYPVSLWLRFAIDQLQLPPLSWLLAHYLWAGLGLYLLLRRRRVRGWLAWTAGAAFLLMPAQVAIGAHGHGSKVMSLAWIPWLLVCADRLLDGKRRFLDCALLALVLAGLLLSAHIQVAYYGLLTVGIYILARALRLWRRSGRRAALTPLGLAMLALLLAAGSAVVLYGPVQEYSQHSIRGVGQGGGADYEYATLWSLHPGEWTTFLAPSSWGFGETSYFGHMPMTNYPNYVGVLILLGAVALFLGGPHKPFDLFFAGLAIATTLVAAGDTFPVLYKPLYALLPWFNRFRVPVMILLLQQIALVILFARGMERALREDAAFARLRATLMAGCALLLLTGIAGPALFGQGFRQALQGKLAPQLARWPANEAQALIAGLADQAAGWLRSDSLLAAFLVALVLAAMEWRRRRPSPRATAVLLGAVLLACVADFARLDHRILHPAKHWAAHAQTQLYGPRQRPTAQLPPQTLAFLEQNLGQQRFWALPGSFFAGNEAAASGLASLGGYHAAKLALADSVLKAVPQGGPELLSRFSVRYLLSNRPLELGEGFPLAFQSEESVYEHRGARPRFFLAEIFRVEPPARSRERLLKDEAEAGVLYLDRAPSISLSAGSGEPGRLDNVSWGLDEVRGRAVLSRPAVAVLADMNYPGWRVFVDGAEQPLLTADGYFRAVAVPAGEHALSFRFLPPHLAAYRNLRLASLALMVALLGLGLWRERTARRARLGGEEAP